MSVAQIRDIFIDPPLAVARLGGSTTPVAAYEWAQSDDPHVEGETSVKPAWTLNVLANGRVSPARPARITFRDGDLIRPVAPFLEVWAVTGDDDDVATWKEEPLTPALLASNGLALASLTFTVNARNRKAARRTGDDALAFGTFPPVSVRADQIGVVALEGSSPAGASPPMIPSGQHIPLGSFRVLRSRPQPAPDATAWASSVNVEVVRVRFTPAKGFVYGPPQAAATRPDGSRAVDPTRAFLNAAAGWAGAEVVPFFVTPADTYDGAEAAAAPNRLGLSAGIIDDTCEVGIEASLRVDQRSLVARANVFVAPPDYAPDRRPFFSAADDLNDRSAGQAERSAALDDAQVDAWVQDLFERVYETVSLMNVDFWRSLRGVRPASPLRPTTIAGDAVPDSTRAMGGRDALRSSLFTVAAPTASNLPLPLAEHARMRHRVLSDLDNLRDLVAQNPGRLRQLVRGVFECEANETGSVTSMRMPPFMRASNALPLTLGAWQYDLLMRWVDRVEAAGAIANAGIGNAAIARGRTAPRAPERLARQAEAHRRRVLQRLGAA